MRRLLSPSGFASETQTRVTIASSKGTTPPPGDIERRGSIILDDGTAPSRADARARRTPLASMRSTGVSGLRSPRRIERGSTALVVLMSRAPSTASFVPTLMAPVVTRLVRSASTSHQTQYQPSLSSSWMPSPPLSLPPASSEAPTARRDTTSTASDASLVSRWSTALRNGLDARSISHSKRALSSQTTFSNVNLGTPNCRDAAASFHTTHR
mmetsp:Transcript_11330/g.36123  ORF Transcript_11330/g.36123 Transcript_11330/m.36123 type:complete len:212 (+) Transcript_11330:1126-1761(+)